MSRSGRANDVLNEWREGREGDLGIKWGEVGSQEVLELLSRIDYDFRADRIEELEAEGKRLRVCGNCRHACFEYGWIDCEHPDNCGVDEQYPDEPPHSLKEVGRFDTCEKWEWHG